MLDLGLVTDNEGAEADQKSGEVKRHQPEQEREPAFGEHAPHAISVTFPVMTGTQPLICGTRVGDTVALGCSQTCGFIKTAIYRELDNGPLINDLQLISARTHPALVLLTIFQIADGAVVGLVEALRRLARIALVANVPSHIPAMPNHASDRFGVAGAG